jgi:hypothetical protein
VVSFKASYLFVQQLNVHGRFAQFLAYTGQLAVVAIERWFFQRVLARVEERFTPGRETSSG